MDDILGLWTTGIFISCTFQRPLGHLVHCALGPLVCDIPALRKAGGFAGHSSVDAFCSFCHLSKANISNLDKNTWPRRSWQQHLRDAAMWRDAETETERAKIFKQKGLRWSELLCLPYWDPTNLPVVDAMHNLFLGEFQHHCWNVWGVDVKSNDMKTKISLYDTKAQAIELEKARKAIIKMSVTGLMALRKGYVIAMAIHNQVSPIGGEFNKRNYADRLIAWVRNVIPGETFLMIFVQQVHQHPNIDIKVPSASAEPTREFIPPGTEYGDASQSNMLGKELVERIQSDIANTFFPSWLVPPPRNFGSASHGKLRADQWRTVCTVSLIITLVHTWGSTSTLELQRRLLSNFMDLVIAVDTTTKWSTSSRNVSIYLTNMTHYLCSLLELFPDHKLQTNHHISLPLKECLARFGPVQGWWSSPFEHYNGIMRDINTNNKLGIWMSNSPLLYLS